MNEDGMLNLNDAALANIVEAVSRPTDLLLDFVVPALVIFLFVGVIGVLFTWAKKQNDFELSNRFWIPHWPVGLRVAILPLLLSYSLTHAFSLGSVIYNTKKIHPNIEVYFQNLGLGRLFALSHAHLFAHATMYFIVAVLVQFSGRGKYYTLLAPLVALWAGIFDVFSWWGLKLLSPNFELLSALCGSSFSIAFLAMAYGIVRGAFTSAPRQSS